MEGLRAWDQAGLSAISCSKARTASTDKLNLAACYRIPMLPHVEPSAVDHGLPGVVEGARHGLDKAYLHRHIGFAQLRTSHLRLSQSQS